MGAGFPNSTPLSFAADIRPKFRPRDVNCMARRHINLSNTTWMCDATGNDDYHDHANARRVFAALTQGAMPPDDAWSQAWLSSYKSWMETGFLP
jgi:hypothetical protein